MKKFEFPLERVLRVRKIREKESQRRTAVALRQLQNEQEKFNRISSDEQKTLEVINNLTSAAKKPAELNMLHGFLTAKRRKRKSQSERVRQADKRLADSRSHLIVRMREKKCMEKLKENQYEAYRKDADKDEQKMLDEVAILRRYKRY